MNTQLKALLKYEETDGYKKFIKEMQKETSDNPYTYGNENIPSRKNCILILPLMKAGIEKLKHHNKFENIDTVVALYWLSEWANVSSFRFELLSPYSKKEMDRSSNQLIALRALMRKKLKELEEPKTPRTKQTLLVSAISQNEFRELAKHLHPDKGGSNEAMQILNTLYNKKKKEETYSDDWLRYEAEKVVIEQMYDFDKSRHERQISKIQDQFISWHKARLNDSMKILKDHK